MVVGRAQESEKTTDMTRQFHFWDYLDAKTASVATVQSKVRKGWKLYRVNQGFGAAGGTANYEHALVGPAGELLKASTRTVEAAGVSAETGTLDLSMLVRLFKEGVYKTHLTTEAIRRGLSGAQDLGAHWNWELRRWMVRPEEAANFIAWLEPNAQPTFMYPSLQPKETLCS